MVGATIHIQRSGRGALQNALHQAGRGPLCVLATAGQLVYLDGGLEDAAKSQCLLFVPGHAWASLNAGMAVSMTPPPRHTSPRSEERRVGKEGRSRWWRAE